MSFEEKRNKLIDKLIKKDILKTPSVINAMRKVARELFVPEDAKSSAYMDTPLSIGSGQTISAPHMNAMMCEYLKLTPGDKLLEIGTGSGYHAALCAEIIASGNSEKPGHVYTIERHEELVVRAKNSIGKAGYEDRITVIHGDGTLGYPEEAPYNKILVTAASPSKIPKPLKQQLQDGGVLCIPAGSKSFGQSLYVITKKGSEYETKNVSGVRFVPLVGKYGFDS